jgi:hypothetical protein
MTAIRFSRCPRDLGADRRLAEVPPRGTKETQNQRR